VKDRAVMVTRILESGCSCRPRRNDRLPVTTPLPASGSSRSTSSSRSTTACFFSRSRKWVRRSGCAIISKSLCCAMSWSRAAWIRLQQLRSKEDSTMLVLLKLQRCKIRGRFRSCRSADRCWRADNSHANLARVADFPAPAAPKRQRETLPFSGRVKENELCVWEKDKGK